MELILWLTLLGYQWDLVPKFRTVLVNHLSIDLANSTSMVVRPYFSTNFIYLSVVAKTAFILLQNRLLQFMISSKFKVIQHYFYDFLVRESKDLFAVFCKICASLDFNIWISKFAQTFGVTGLHEIYF